jgi:hypothetical protein
MMVAAALLGACSPDYSAVRDWSDGARNAVLPLTVPRVAPAVAPAPVPAVTEDGRAGAALALQEGAAAWLGLLAYLADDGEPSDRTNQLTELAARVQPEDAEGAAALADLGQVIRFAALRGWRAPQLREAIGRGDESFQKVMASLQRMAVPEGPPLEPLPVLPANATAGQRVALQELAALRENELARARTARAARLATMRQVAEGHALLKARLSTLSQSETARILRAQEAELRRLVLLSAAG